MAIQILSNLNYPIGNIINQELLNANSAKMAVAFLNDSGVKVIDGLRYGIYFSKNPQAFFMVIPMKIQCTVKDVLRKIRPPLAKWFKKKSFFKQFIAQKNMPLPEWIQLEPTPRCNLHCGTCTRETMAPERLNKDLSLDEFKKIVSQFPTLKEIKFQGMGEPLLCRSLKSMLEYGTSIGIRFTMISNGTILTDENIELVLKYISHFTISVDAGSKQTFEKVRAGANYERVMENISKLIKQKTELKSKTLIAMSFVVTHLNYHEIPTFIELCEKVGADEFGLVEVENWLMPTQEEYESSKEFIRLAREVNAQKYITNYKGKMKPNYLSSLKRKATCPWSFNWCYITAGGFVTPCCIRTNPDAFNFGNIFETPLKDIWNGKKIKKFRRANRTDSPNPICDFCPD